MAHVKVVRRSMSLEQWARLQFARVGDLVVAQRVATKNWKVRIGQYFPEGYEWDADFQDIDAGDFWGRPDGTAQFMGCARIPDAMAGSRVWLEFVTGAEVIVYKDGRMLDGIDPNRSRVILTEDAQPGQAVDLMMEAYTRSKPDDDRAVTTRNIRGCVQRFNPPHLVVLNEEALALKYDLDVLYNMIFGRMTPEGVRERLEYDVNELMGIFPLYDSDMDALAAAVPRIRAYLRDRVFTGGEVYGHAGRLACVAHSHLDIAYHWKVAQSVQKNARTCLIQLRLMDRYPEFGYAHTQAWTYETLERHYPALFEEIRQRVAEGRWEIVGGMYIEPDCNVPSAEALIRQVVYGKRYFLEKFGVEVDNCWLPDVFGNTCILPQILKIGGIDHFVSNKMSTWNDTNRFPHNNFIWRGLDGTEVHACVPPVHFITWMEPGQAIESWEAFQDKDVCDESLHMYGYGDGGSGVTEEMLENYERLKKLPGLPALRLTSGREYLHTSYEKSRERLSVWDGELYLEMHRGTFTTKGVLKRENRQGEFLAQEVETLCALAALAGMAYPTAELRDAWKLLLLNQFHDILPGSHTNAVYHEAMETYARMRDAFRAQRDRALSVIAPETGPGDVCVFNPFSDTRSGIAILDDADGLDAGSALEDDDGHRYPVQKQVVPHDRDRTVVGIPEIPPLGARSFAIVSSGDAAPCVAFRATEDVLENAFFRLRFDRDHRLVGIYDKRRDREIVPEGAAANAWQLFEDKPGNYNAWDILPNYEDHPVELPGWASRSLVENGPLSIAVRLRRSFGDSQAEQVIRLYGDVPRNDFETWVDWQETERLLKVAFPVTVRSRVYTTDTSAGVLERDNHRNTPWQEARFEVCGHKWVDLSEGLFGVALMNDCKYGCDVRDHVMRLTLLKAPIRPDRVSDKGEHRFTYSLFAHGGDWRRDGLVEAAYDLNWPLAALKGRRGSAMDGKAGMHIDTRAVKCFALKFDEDGKGDVIVRLAELYGSHGVASVRPAFTFRQAFYCDTLERRIGEAEICDGAVKASFRPYQIQTLRFVR